MLAYSSLSHVGFSLLALFAVASTGRPGLNAAAGASALNGAILQIFNHGVAAAAFFYCAGVLTGRRPGADGIDDFGGLQASAPRLAWLCGITLFATLGLPGLGGFVGEFFIIRGVFGLAPWAAALAALGLIITALYLLTFWQKVFHGPANGPAFRDLNPLEVSVLFPLVVAMVLVGIAPQLLLQLMNPLVAAWSGLTPP
jgi:NADH-quinone oxidoreductase subunit M